MSIIAYLTKSTEKYLASFPCLIKLYGLYYKKIVQREIALGKICSKDKVLFIGGGPLPCTALEIAQNTGAHVLVVDNDPEAVITAREVVAKFNLSEKIHVKVADGLRIDVAGFSVVHVALQVNNREEVLKNVWQKASQGARIIVRSHRDSLKGFYSKLPDWCRHKNCRYIEQKNCTMNVTLLLTKEQGRVQDEKISPAYNRSAVSYSAS